MACRLFSQCRYGCAYSPHGLKGLVAGPPLSLDQQLRGSFEPEVVHPLPRPPKQMSVHLGFPLARLELQLQIACHVCWEED